MDEMFIKIGGESLTGYEGYTSLTLIFLWRRRSDDSYERMYVVWVRWHSSVEDALRHIIDTFEKEGYSVVGYKDVESNPISWLLGEGKLLEAALLNYHMSDIDRQPVAVRVVWARDNSMPSEYSDVFAIRLVYEGLYLDNCRQ